MSRVIKNPRWANEQKTHIMCEFHYPDGRLMTASITNTDEGNPDWNEIMDTFGADGVDENTAKDLAAHEAKKLEIIERRAQEADLAKKEVLFSAKSEAFDLPVIRDSENKELKTALRRATTLLEVQAYATLIIQDSLTK